MAAVSKFCCLKTGAWKKLEREVCTQDFPRDIAKGIRDIANPRSVQVGERGLTKMRVGEDKERCGLTWPKEKGPRCNRAASTTGYAVVVAAGLNRSPNFKLAVAEGEPRIRLPVREDFGVVAWSPSHPLSLNDAWACQ